MQTLNRLLALNKEEYVRCLLFKTILETAIVQTVIVASITSRIKHPLPTHVSLDSNRCGLSHDSTIMLEQIRTLDKQRLSCYIGRIETSTMDQVDHALLVSLGIHDKP